MKFSVVMPSFNQAPFVEAALQSLLSQSYKDLEIILIDGGSTDGTMEIVEKYRDRLAYCISEPDEGQSDALRKGFSKATGEIFTWLSTDDLLLPGAIEQAARVFKKYKKISWILGNVVLIDKENVIQKCWRGESHTPGWMRLGLFAAGGPSAFFRRELYERVGGVNLNLHYQMDTDLWWRFAMAGESFFRLPNYIWALRLHENAKTSGHMFSLENSHEQKKISEAQRNEYQYIKENTKKFRRYEHRFISPSLSIIRKITSPAYIRGLLENQIYKGDNLSTLTENKSNNKR